MRELSFSGWGDLGKGVVRCSNVMLTLCLVSDFIKSILKTMKVIFKVLYQGPGLFFVIPCTDTFRFVQRIRTCLYQKQIRDYQAKHCFSSLLLGVLISELSRLMSLPKRSSVYEDWTNFSKTLKCSADIDEGLCYYICWCCDLLENIKVFEKLRMKIFQRWSNLALQELENKLKNKALCDIFG